MGGTTRKALGIGGGLIALYLVVVYFKGATSDANAAANGGIGFVKAFQGR